MGSQTKQYLYRRLQLAEELYTLTVSSEARSFEKPRKLALSAEGACWGRIPEVEFGVHRHSLSRCLCVFPVSRFLVWETSSDSENHCLSVKIACQSERVKRTHMWCFSHQKPAGITVVHGSVVTGSLRTEARRKPPSRISCDALKPRSSRLNKDLTIALISERPKN